jgi:hypothetical protein
LPPTLLRLEPLEDRMLLSSYTAFTATDLVNDITAANTSGGTNTITLGADITLEAANNSINGGNGLPVIAAGDNLTILGQGHTIARDQYSSSSFRLFDVSSGASLNLQNLALSGGRLFGGSGTAAEGGGIYNSGNLTLGGVTVETNTVQGARGSSLGTKGNPSARGVAGASGMGGGVYVAGGVVALTDNYFRFNTAVGGSGGFGGGSHSGKDGTGGAGGNGAGAGVYVAGGSVTLTNNTFFADAAAGGRGGYGGSLFRSIHGGTGGRGGNAQGGGVYVGGGTVALTNNTILFMNANAGPGGNGSPGGSGGSGGSAQGGGVYVDAGAATVTLLNDTLNGNYANGANGGNAGKGSSGGNGGNGGNGQGGGLFVVSGGTTTLANTVIAQNYVTAGAGGSGETNGTAGTPGSASATDVSATVTSSDHDLIGDGSGFSATTSNGDQVGSSSNPIDPLLENALSNNGGPTLTKVLRTGSPAIDAGDSSAPGLPATDQRGFARIVGTTVDIGAYEYNPADYNAGAAAVDLSVTASTPPRQSPPAGRSPTR